MESLRVERAQITVGDMTFSPTVDHWLPQIEINAVIRRTPLINEQLAAFSARILTASVLMPSTRVRIQPALIVRMSMN